MTKNKKKYRSLKLLTIFLTSIMLPFGTFVGFQFGAGHTETALVALVCQTALTAFQSYVWWLTLEFEGKK
jgi:hypothetical protein